ncbi:hypothetical protein AT6N2_C0053 [Agrobacterium tumefaciens]|nr:hypothetical protein AT6N2_C0053 [Agrobacterium tumefaciens]
MLRLHGGDARGNALTAIARGPLGNEKMGRRPRRHLRCMGNGENLYGFGQAAQTLADGIRHCSANAGVDFIEDQRGCRAAVGKRDFQCQKEARQLAARGNLHDRAGARARIGLDVEFHRIDAVSRRLFGIGRHLDRKPRPLQFQRREFRHHGARKSLRGMTALLRKRVGGPVEISFDHTEIGLELAELFFTGIEVGEIGNHFFGESRKVRYGDVVFASSGAQRKQPLLYPLELTRIELGAAQSRLHFHLRVGEAIERGIQQLYGVFQKAGRLMALTFQTPHHRGDDRHGRSIAIQKFARLSDITGNTFGFLHHGPTFCQLILFAVARRKRFQFLDGGPQVIRLTRRRLHLGAVGLQRPFGIFPGPVESLNAPRLIAEPGKGIQQGAVRVGIDKGAVVVLAMDFDQQLTELPHHLHAYGLVVDISLGAPVGRLNATENKIAVVIETIFAQQKPGRMIVRNFESGRHLPLVFAVAHEAAVPAPAKGKRKTVKQNGFARTRLARQHGKARLETEVEPFDENDIANRELDQHGLCPVSGADELLTGARNPGSLVFTRFETLTLQQLVGVSVPLAIGIVVTEYGSSRLGFIRQTHGIIGFGQTRERFLDLVGVLILLDHDAEARHGSKIFLALEVITADLHFAAGKLVASETDLGLCVGHVFRIGIIRHDLVHRFDSTLCGALVLRHVRNLLRIGKTDHVLNVGGILRARILAQEPAAGRDGHVVLVGACGNECLHDKRLLSPFGERVLLVDRLELA